MLGKYRLMNNKRNLAYLSPFLDTPNVSCNVPESSDSACRSGVPWSAILPHTSSITVCLSVQKIHTTLSHLQHESAMRSVTSARLRVYACMELLGLSTPVSASVSVSVSLVCTLGACSDCEPNTKLFNPYVAF